MVAAIGGVAVKFYTWSIEIQIAAAWVADGFDITDAKAHNIMARHLSWANGSEIRARVLTRPPDAEVAEEMGYSDVMEYLAKRGG